MSDQLSFRLRGRDRWLAVRRVRGPAAAVKAIYLVSLQANTWIGNGSLAERLGASLIMGLQIASAALLGLAMAGRLTGFEPLAPDFDRP